MAIGIKSGTQVKQYIHLLLDEELVKKVDAMAEESNTSRTEIVKRALAEYHDKWCDRMGS